MPKKDDTPRVVDFTIDVRVARLGDGYIALARMAGQEFRGNRYESRYQAAKDLFRQLSQEANLDANLALDIAASGEDPTALGFDEPARPELAAADPDAPSAEFLAGVRYALENPSDVAYVRPSEEVTGGT